MHAEKTSGGSLHANEPITAFVFLGSETDPTNQKIIVSLSNSLRIYKLRTLQLLHVISLKDVKTNNTPIFSMMNHPVFDHYLLLSSDNQLRLFDVNEERVLKTFSARNLDYGMRLKGKFSPCGSFIHACSGDGRQGTHAKKYDSTPLTGHYIWRVNTGTLETNEMQAMDYCGDWDHKGAILSPTSTLTGDWLIASDRSSKKHTRRKIFVSTGVDKIIRLYM